MHIFIVDCSCSNKFMKYMENCHSLTRTCFLWSNKSMSWFSSRNWCFKKGGHLMNKSNLNQYVPPYSVTSKHYYWIGMRKADWVIKSVSPGMDFYMINLMVTVS